MHTESRTGQLLHEDHHRLIDLLNELETHLERWKDKRLPVPDAAEHQALSPHRGRRSL